MVIMVISVKSRGDELESTVKLDFPELMLEFVFKGGFYLFHVEIDLTKVFIH